MGRLNAGGTSWPRGMQILGPGGWDSLACRAAPRSTCFPWAPAEPPPGLESGPSGVTVVHSAYRGSLWTWGTGDPCGCFPEGCWERKLGPASWGEELPLHLSSGPGARSVCGGASPEGDVSGSQGDSSCGGHVCGHLPSWSQATVRGASLGPGAAVTNTEDHMASRELCPGVWTEEVSVSGLVSSLVSQPVTGTSSFSGSPATRQRLGGQRRALAKGRGSSESTFGARTIPFTFEWCPGSPSIPASGASFSSGSPLPVALSGEVLWLVTPQAASVGSRAGRLVTLNWACACVSRKLTKCRLHGAE